MGWSRHQESGASRELEATSRLRQSRSARGGRLPWWLAALLVVALSFLGRARSDDPPETIELFVDPAAGQDVPSAGAREAPLRTLHYAESSALGRQPASGAELRLRLLRGEHAVGSDDRPWQPAAQWGRVSLLGEGEEVVLRGMPGGGAPLLRTEATAELRSVRLEGLTLQGGYAGLVHESAPGTGPLVFVEIHRCRFHGQRGPAVLFGLGSEARLGLTVRDSLVEDGRGGVAIQTSPQAVATVTIEGCAFERIEKYGAGARLGSGVDVHVDARAAIDLRILRCRFLGVAAALQVTTPDPRAAGGAPAGRLTGLFASNWVAGGGPAQDAGEPSAVLRGLALDLFPGTGIELSVLNNTFVGILGPVVDLAGPETALELEGDLSLIFVNNLCAGTGGESEFNVEALAGPALEFPPPGWTVASNRLEKSGLAALHAFGNFSEDPLFVDPEGGDYQLQPESPAIDRGIDTGRSLGPLDAAGSCRRSSSRCEAGGPPQPLDLGAFERFGGFCEEDPETFVRGDCKLDGSVDMPDAVRVLQFLFLGGAEPSCLDACDASDDGLVLINDAIYILGFLFVGGPPPPAPWGAPGHDPTRDCTKACQ